MCDPIIAGVATFASGALGAVGQHQSAQANADYQNEVSRRNYEHAVKTREAEWQSKLAIWNNNKVDFKNQLDSNYAAAARAYAAEQARLNESFMQAAFQKQDMLAQLVQGRGTIAASGRSGKSVAKMDQAMLAAFGRNNAILSENLRSARGAMIQRNEQTRLQLQSGNNQAWSSVGMAPVPGVAPLQPTMVAGPSGIGLASGLLGAAVSGFSTYSSLKAPNAGGGGGGSGNNYTWGDTAGMTNPWSNPAALKGMDLGIKPITSPYKFPSNLNIGNSFADYSQYTFANPWNR